MLVMATASTALARHTYPIDDGWQFYFANENSGDNARTVTLPHTWSSDPSNIIQSVGNYDRVLYIPREWQGERLFLRFAGAESVADVFVNGSHVGDHHGAYTAFTVEITDYVRFGEDNLIHVVVSNAWRSDLLPLSSDMNLSGGLTRGVELIVTPPTTISPLHLGSSGVLVHQRSVSQQRAEGEIEVHLCSKGAVQGNLHVKVLDREGYAASMRTIRAKIDGAKRVMVPFAVESPALWSTSHPNLYTVSVVMEPDGGVADTVEVVTGFRRIDVTGDGGFMLNGKRIDLRGVNLAHDGATPRARYAQYIDLISELGANALRSEGGAHDQYLYDECDRRGYAVWVDMPLTQAPYIADIALHSSKRLSESTSRQAQELVAQNRNHPSVVMWGVFSLLHQRGEQTLDFVKRLNTEIKQLDPSRPTVACSNRNGDVNFVTDLIVWQQNVGWEQGRLSDVGLWCEQLRTNWSHLKSGVTYGEEGDIDIQVEHVARSSSRHSERRSRLFHERYAAQICNDNTQFWGVWLSSLADYSSSRHADGVINKGLVSRDLTRRKDAFYLYKALWNRSERTLHIAERALRHRSSEPQRFMVYSSAGVPILTIGDDTLQVEQIAPCCFLSDSISLVGDVTLRARAGALEECIEFNAGSLLAPRAKQDLHRIEDR